MAENREQVTDAIIIAYIQGNLDDTAQIKMVEQWLSDDQNKEKAKSVYRAWELSALTAPTTRDTDKAYDQLLNKINPKKKSKSVSIWWYAAASVTLLLIAIFLLRPDQTADVIQLTAQTEAKDFTLPDGSIVSIDLEGSIEYDQNELTDGNQRSIKLTGQAYFEVAHNPSKPFVISTHDAQITVLGTKFMVKTSPTNPTKVLVTEGKVSVVYTSSPKELILTAEQETETENTNPSVKPSDDNQLYWKTGIMKFENAEMSQVIHTLSQEFNTPIIAQNDQILTCKLTATFRKQSLETILKVLGNIHQLNIEKVGDSIILTGNGCD